MKLNPDRIEIKTHEVIDKKGRKTEWSWEEGPELREFIAKQDKVRAATEQLHKDIKLNKNITDTVTNVEPQS